MARPEHAGSANSKRLIVVAVACVSAAGLIALIAVMAVQFICAQTWSDDTTFSARVADAVAEAVGDGVTEALHDAEEDLADSSINGKPITLDDLVHWQDLFVRGEHEQARKELNSRFTADEIQQLAQTLRRLTNVWAERAGLTSTDLKELSESVEQLSNQTAERQANP